MPNRSRRRLGPLVWMLVGALSLLAACTEDPDENPTASEAPLAHDVDIALVEIDQGVAIPLAEAGEWIAPDLRSAPIVKGREALVRVHWSLGAEFEARPITARLILERPDVVEPIVYEQTMMVTGEALTDSFSFELRGDELVPGLRFSASLHEVEASRAESTAKRPAPIAPREGGTAPVGVRPEHTQIELVLVPVQLQWPGCSTLVELSEVASIYDEVVYSNSPTQSLTTRVHDEALVITREPASIVELLEPLQRLRAEDHADTRAYYYGVFEGCGSLLDDVEGVSPIAAPDPAAGWLRVGVGRLGDDPQHGAELLVHQLGHLHGLGHGDTDGTWAETFARISTVSSWDRPDRSGAAEQTLLLGWIADDGQRYWWTTRGRIPIEMLASERVVAIDHRAEALLAARLQLPDAQGTLIGIELPEKVPEHIELVGSPIAVPSDALRAALSELEHHS